MIWWVLRVCCVGSGYLGRGDMIGVMPLLLLLMHLMHLMHLRHGRVMPYRRLLRRRASLQHCGESLDGNRQRQ